MANVNLRLRKRLSAITFLSIFIMLSGIRRQLIKYLQAVWDTAQGKHADLIISKLHFNTDAKKSQKCLLCNDVFFTL